MTLDEFHNGLRVMINLDLWALQDEGLFTERDAATGKEWPSFRDNPWRYLIKCSDKEAAKIWSAMEKRMKS